MTAFATIDASNAGQLIAVVDGLYDLERHWLAVVHHNGWNQYRAETLGAIRTVLAKIHAQNPAACADAWTRHCRNLDAIEGGWA